MTRMTNAEWHTLRTLADGVIAADQCSSAYDSLCSDLRQRLQTAGLIEVLSQLVNCGPVEDGDIVSKGDRDMLLELGLASRVYVKGEQGYTAANYRGGNVLHAAAV